MGRALWVSAATMTSRVLGLARDLLFAALIGANRFSDAYVVAFRIPNLLRDLFAEGALSAAFVPTFADYEHNRGREAAYSLAGTLIALVLVVVGALTLAGVMFAQPLVHLLAPGFEPGQSVLAATLTEIMMPFLLLISLAAVAMGMLNAQGRFTAPALAPASFNVGSILVGLGLWMAGAGVRRAVIGWSLGTLFGGLLQLVTQLPSLWRAGFSPRLSLARQALREPGLARIGRLMTAAVVGLSATQVNILVNTIFASHVLGANTYLQLAFRLMQLPLGVFGVAIATVAGAGVAQRAAAGDMEGVNRTLGSAMRLVAFLNVPSTVGLIVLAEPIIGLIYQHGHFTAGDTAGTAAALLFYAIGLYGYSAVKVFAPAFYATGSARVPVIGSILGMVANVVLNFTLFPVLSYRGVALGTSLAATVNFLVLLFAWRSQHGRFAGERLFRQFAQVLVASLVTGAAAWAVHFFLLSAAPGPALASRLLRGLVPVVAGGVVYLAVARALRVGELEDLLGAFRRRRKRRQAA